MEHLFSILNNLYLPKLNIIDILEIILLIFASYKILTSLRGSRAMVIIKGLIILMFSYFVAYLFSFDVILLLFEKALTFVVFAILIVFQPELRKFLESIGTKNISKGFFVGLFKKNTEPEHYWTERTADAIVDAAFRMGEAKTGALIVLERDIPLNDYSRTGIQINADISSALLINTFEHNTPLHDGAVIIRKDKIVAATCYLPLSESTHINKAMGTRHRAGIGVTENTDCLTIIVSEETGSVSLAYEGKIRHDISKANLVKKMKEFQDKKNIDIQAAATKKIDLKHNWKRKLGALGMGIAIWLTAMNIANPITTVSFKNIPITIANENVVTSIGKTYDISSEKSVSVKIKGHRAEVESIKRDDIIITADMSKMSYVYSVPLSGKVNNLPNVEIMFENNKDSITVTLDDIVDKEFPVTTEKAGKEPEGIYVSELVPEEETVIVTGPKTLVNKIDKIVYSVNVSEVGMDNNSLLSEAKILDKYSSIIKDDKIALSKDKIEIKAKILPTKSVPVNIKLTASSGAKYKILSTDYEPKMVAVAGTEKELSKLTEINCEIESNIDMTTTSLANEYTRVVDIKEYIPEEYHLVGEDSNINVVSQLSLYETKEISVSKNNIALTNVPKKLEAVILDDEYAIVLTGTKEALENVKAEDIEITLSLAGLEAGTYNLTGQMEEIADVKLNDSLTINVELKKK